MNQGTSSYDQIMKILNSFDHEKLDEWEMTLTHQEVTNLKNTCKFASYFEDIKGFPQTSAIFTMNYPDYEMNLTEICFGQDATEGVDIILSRDEIASKLGPDSIPEGKTERPLPTEVKNTETKKKKKKKDHEHRKKNHHNPMSKSKSMAAIADM